MSEETIKFVGKAYVEVERGQTDKCYVCVDGNNASGIVLRMFTRNEVARARTMAEMLNEWAGKN